MKVKQIDAKELEKKANDFHTLGKSWHFHLLTPSCQLNTEKNHAFILENSTDRETYVTYSKVPNRELGQKLLKLLHGITIGRNQNKSKQTKLPADVQIIVDRARELTSLGHYWHHYLCLPTCIYNTTNKYLIMFEDQENKKTLEAFSDTEPKASLQIIESLYYQQKDLK